MMFNIFSSILVLFFQFNIAWSQSGHLVVDGHRTGIIMDKGFTALKDVDGTIIEDMRFCSENNFIGRVVRGYKKGCHCILTLEAAENLKKVQTELIARGSNTNSGETLSLKVFDCYRPQQAVDEMYSWSKDMHDQVKKKEYYPHLDKRNLFKKGYILSKSSHSRGSAVDVGITTTSIDRHKNTNVGVRELFMGKTFGVFEGEPSKLTREKTQEAENNRLFLKNLMEKHSFQGEKNNPWHFTLINEPFPHGYFEFPVP